MPSDMEELVCVITAHVGRIPEGSKYRRLCHLDGADMAEGARPRRRYLDGRKASQRLFVGHIGRDPESADARHDEDGSVDGCARPRHHADPVP